MSHEASSPTASPEKKALLDAFDTVLKTKADEREAERAADEARRQARATSRPLMLACITILVAVWAYLYIERPDWVFPAEPQTASLAVREAGLRITMATAAQHVERYRQQTGELPTTLKQAGGYGEGITYERRGSGYRLEGELGDVHVIFDSSEPLARFVGNSFKVISRSAK
jgi:hypothetical protein